MIREGIKFKNKDVININTMFDQLEAVKNLMQLIPDINPSTRLQTGLILRQAREMWVSVFVPGLVSLCFPCFLFV